MFENVKIIYLEDEPLIAIDTGEYLQSLGFEKVEIAHRLEKANEAADEMDFDLALLDINVNGGQTSFELGQMLSERGTKVVFASGRSSSTQQIEENGHYFLSKPFSLVDVRDKLAEILEASEQ